MLDRSSLESILLPTSTPTAIDTSIMASLGRPGMRRKSSAMLLNALPSTRPDTRDFLVDADRSDSISITPSMASSAASAYYSAGGGAYGLHPSNASPSSSFAATSSPNGSGGGVGGGGAATMGPPPSTPSAGVAASTSATIKSHAQELENVRYMAHKRITTFVYLKKAHEGRVHWFNTVLITRQDLDAAFSPAKMQQRTMRFTVLGLSFASLMDITAPGDFLKALLNLLGEYEAMTDANYRPRMRAIFKTTKTSRKSTTGSAEYPLSIQESGETSYLFSPNIPFDLDYFQVLYALCDSIVEIYQKFLLFLAPANPAPATPSTAGLTTATSTTPNPTTPSPSSIVTHHTSLTTPNSGLALSHSSHQLFAPHISYPVTAQSSAATSPAASVSNLTLAIPATWNNIASTTSSLQPQSNLTSSSNGMNITHVGGQPLNGILTPAGCDMVWKIDGKLKRIITVITKELDALARNSIRDEITKLDLMLGGMSASELSQDGSFFAD